MIGTVKSFFTTKKSFENDDNFISASNFSIYGQNTPSRLSKSEYLKYYKGWVYAATSAIAEGVSGLEYHIENEKGEVISNDILSLITPELIENIVSYMKLSGTCYLLKNMIGNKVGSFTVLIPSYVTYKLDKFGRIEHFDYNFKGNTFRFQSDDVVVFANFNPFQPYPHTHRGYSEVQATAMTIQLDDGSEFWNLGRFHKASTIDGMLTTDQEISREAKERIDEMRRSKYQGAGNGHKVAVLHNGLKYVDIKAPQRELDFVNSQRWNMDKILAIFKVPRAVLGIGESVNVGNVKAFDLIFARRTIKPLAMKIARIMTDNLLQGVGTFVFDNMIPVDVADVNNSYLTGISFKNEARQKLGLPHDKGGDVYIDGTEAIIEDKKTVKQLITVEKGLIKSVECAVLKSTPGTIEYNEERCQKKSQRASKSEKAYKIALKRIFKKQEEDILGQFEEKGIKKTSVQLGKKYIALYLSLLKKPQADILQEEGDIAMSEIDLDKRFNILSPAMVSWQKKNLQDLASSVDSVTDKKLSDAIGVGADAGLSPLEIKESVKSVFTELTNTRLTRIVRTETIRTGTEGQVSAREQSGVVKGKERYTAQDERVCEFCGPMHGKTIPVRNNFFDKGSKFTGSKGGVLSLDYSDTIGSPLHPQCRCDLIPIVD